MIPTVITEANKAPAGTMPDIYGLRDAIQGKKNAISAPDAAAATQLRSAAGPRMYVQDVWSGVPVSMVSQSAPAVNEKTLANGGETGRNAENGATGNVISDVPIEASFATAEADSYTYNRWNCNNVSGSALDFLSDHLAIRGVMRNTSRAAVFVYLSCRH